MPRPLPDRRDTWTDDDARRVLDAWRASGESIPAFAKRHELTPQRLYWWKRRLAEPNPEPELPFVPATVIPSEAVITIRAGNIAVEIDNASPSWVAALVTELMQRHS